MIWQLGEGIRVRTLVFTDRPRFQRDLRLREQLESAVNSICFNIAEGYAAETHADFARFLVIARKSLNEVKDAFHAAELKGHVTHDELKEMCRLMGRLLAALASFIDYLQRNPKQRRRPKPRRPPP